MERTDLLCYDVLLANDGGNNNIYLLLTRIRNRSEEMQQTIFS